MDIVERLFSVLEDLHWDHNIIPFLPRSGT